MKSRAILAWGIIFFVAFSWIQVPAFGGYFYETPNGSSLYRMNPADASTTRVGSFGTDRFPELVYVPEPATLLLLGLDGIVKT